MKQVFSVITAFIMFVLGIAMPVPEQKTELEIADLADICFEVEPAEELCVIDVSQLKTQAEMHAAIALQGIVAKKAPSIFVKNNSICNDYLKLAEKAGIKIVYNDENGNPWTLKTLLNKFKSYIGESGYVLYRESERAEGLNMTTNLAALYGWLPLHKDLEQLAIDAGLELKEDYSEKSYNVLFQWHFFEKHKKEFNNKAIMSLKYEVNGLRDLAIQQGFFTFYIDDDKDTNLLRGRVMDYSGDNVPVLGWVKYEVAFVDQASKEGNIALPSDHSYNNSFLASFECDIPEQTYKAKKYTDETKHYCAIVYSDGDNLQWIQNGYAEFYKLNSIKTKIPITWSFPPLLAEFSSATVNTIYSDAGDTNYFMAGVSGAGYIHPTQYPTDALEGFTDLTAASMELSNLSYVQILDSVPENKWEETKLLNALEYYARYDNIKGGTLSLDPTRYAGGEGIVYFVNDKPFASMRLSLWHPDGEKADVTAEWLDQQAAIVNSYPADIKTVNGYSVVNVHPWSVSVENLAYFVSRLDEDVVLVSIDELLTMMSENVPHVTAKPE